MLRPNTHTPSFFFEYKLPDSPENLHNTTREERTSKMASNWKMKEHGDLFFLHGNVFRNTNYFAWGIHCLHMVSLSKGH